MVFNGDIGTVLDVDSDGHSVVVRFVTSAGSGSSRDVMYTGALELAELLRAWAITVRGGGATSRLPPARAA